MTESPAAEFIFPHQTVRWWPWGATVHFPDGSWAPASPPEEPGYAERIRRLGYAPDEAVRQTQEHELFHALLGELVYGGPSPTLYAAARRRSDPTVPWFHGWREEEARNLGLAAHLNAWCRGRAVRWP